MNGKIMVGTSSWSDPGFIADWYPRSLPASERLPYYATRFGLVELNSSFYAIPSRRLVERWCDQTPKDFVFDVKLHKLLSRHSTGPESLPKALRPKAELRGKKVLLTPQLETAVARQFLEGIEPFRECGKMGALLLQLTPSFDPKSHQLEELDHLLGLLEGYPIAVELRNRYWVTDERLEETKAFFERRKIAFVVVDAPTSRHFMVMPKVLIVTNRQLAYMRLHGRNAKGYISGKSVAERFDYQYSDEEIRETLEEAHELASAAANVHVLYNNNSSDYALRAAATFQEQLQEIHPANVPSATRRKVHSGLGQTLELALEQEK